MLQRSLKLGTHLLILVLIATAFMTTYGATAYAASYSTYQVNSAKAALAAAGTLKPVEGVDTSIQAMAQKIVNKASTGVNVKVTKSTNPQIQGSTIVYGSNSAEGTVTFILTKRYAVAKQSKLVIVPATSKVAPETPTVPTTPEAPTVPTTPTAPETPTTPTTPETPTVPTTPTTPGIVANAYYVSTSGNDSNPGTAAAPWRTIQKAANTVVAGDTVYIKGGTYNERVILKNSGTAGKYITFTNYPNETVIMNGTGIYFDYGSCLFDINGCDYIYVKGIRVENSASAGIGSAKGNSESSQDYTQSSSYVTVENCYTYNTGRSGIHFKCSNHITVKGNVINKPNTIIDQEALTLDCVEYFEVSNNEIVNQCKEGIDIKVGSRYGTVHDNIIHNPLYLAKDTNGTAYQHCYEAIYIDGAQFKTHDIEIYNNNIYDMTPVQGGWSNMVNLSSEQLRSTGTAADPDIYNIYIHNNTAKNISNGLILSCGYVNEGRYDAEYKNIRFENNEVSGLTSRMFLFGSQHAHDIHILNNNLSFKNSDATLAQIYINNTTGTRLYDPATTYFSGNQISVDSVTINPSTWTNLKTLLGSNYTDNTMIAFK